MGSLPLIPSWEAHTHRIASQTGIKPQTNDLLSQFLLPDASGVFFNKKFQGMLKGKRSNLKKKEASEPDSGDIVQILELSDKEFNYYD